MTGERDLVPALALFFVERNYEPGERVPSERELAERFKTGRGVVREALAYLEALRVIERRAKSGIYMSGDAASVEALALFAEMGIPLKLEEVRQSNEMRRIHEITAARLACERALLGNFDRMRAVLGASETRIAKGEPIDLEDRDFHLEIVNATQNNVFYRIVRIFYMMTAERRRIYFQRPERCRESHAEHERIFDAIARRDAVEAMELMDAHLKGVESYWQGLLEQPNAAPTVEPEAAWARHIAG
jgi:GntR family transcriptional regulator, transcriptional repressor for pyruvate dehydrogenase complex